MRRIVRCTALAVLSLSVSFLSAAAQEGSGSADRTKILALENIWNQAESRGDTKGLDQLFDEALIYVDEDGSLKTKTQFLASVKTAGSETEQLITESMTVSSYGATAVVSGVYIIKGKKSGKPFVRRGRFLDTWVYINNKWVCVAVDATPIRK